MKVGLTFLAPILATLLMTSVSSAKTDETRYETSIDGKSVSFQVSSRPFKMVALNAPWSAADAPIHLKIVGPDPTVTIAARPTYGLFFEPGHHVYVTMHAKYFDPGDASPSERIDRGEPIRPDVRKASGFATMLLPIDRRHAITFLVTILENGMAYVRFAHGPDLRAARGYCCSAAR